MVSLTGQQLRKTPPIHRLLGSRSQRRLHCRKCTVVTDTNTCCPQPKLRDSESSYFLCPSKENEEVDSNLRKANNYWRRRGLLRGTILQAFLTSKNCLETSRSTGTIWYNPKATRPKTLQILPSKLSCKLWHNPFPSSKP